MGRRDITIPYRHDVAEWTVGELAKAIGVPDDVELTVPRTASIRVSTLRAPSSNKVDGGDMEEGRYAVVYGGLEPDWVPPQYVDGDRVEGYFRDPGTTFVIGTDFPSGDYERHEEKWD